MGKETVSPEQPRPESTQIANNFLVRLGRKACSYIPSEANVSEALTRFTIKAGRLPLIAFAGGIITDQMIENVALHRWESAIFDGIVLAGVIGAGYIKKRGTKNFEKILKAEEILEKHREAHERGRRIRMHKSQ